MSDAEVSQRTQSGPATVGKNPADERLSRLAWIVASIGLAMLLLGVYLAVLRRPAGELESEPTWIGEIVFSAAMSVSLIVGGFVASRQPRNVYGWLLLAFGFGIGSIQGVPQNYGIYSYLVAPTPPPLAPPTFFFAGMGLALTLASVSLLFLLFPTGRLPSGRWWFLVVPVILAFVSLSAFSWLAPNANPSPAPNPFHGTGPLADLANTVTSTAALVLIAAVIISAISVTVRGLRAKGTERQQFKWLAFAALSLVLAEFARTMRDETDLDKLTAELVRVIQQTMQPEFVALWLIDPPALAAQ